MHVHDFATWDTPDAPWLQNAGFASPPWHYFIAPYVNVSRYRFRLECTPKQLGVFNCPSVENKSPNGQTHFGWGGLTYNSYGYSYAVNAWGYATVLGNSGLIGSHKLARITKPSNRFAAIEGFGMGGAMFEHLISWDDGSGTIPYTGGGIRNARYPHEMSGNIIYADGHASGELRGLLRKADVGSDWEPRWKNL